MDITKITVQQINNLPKTQEIFDELTTLGLTEECVWRKLVFIAIRDHVFSGDSEVSYCCYDCAYRYRRDLLLRKFCGSDKLVMPIEFYMITGLLSMFYKDEHQELKNLQLFDYDAIETLRETPIRFCYLFSDTKYLFNMDQE